MIPKRFLNKKLINRYISCLIGALIAIITYNK